MESNSRESAAIPVQFVVAHQKVELDIDFSRQLRGRTEITIYPESKDVKTIALHARQCRIDKISVNGSQPAFYRFQDPCDQLYLHTESTANQHHILSSKLTPALSVSPVENLVVGLPANLRIKEVNLAEVHTQSAGTIKINKPDESIAANAENQASLTDTTIARFTPLTVVLEFSSIHTRDALHFVSGYPGSGRWPHVYTRSGFGGGRASCLFPCIDSLTSRCTWEISIKSARTVGDAIRQAIGQQQDLDAKKQMTTSAYESKELVFLCTGEISDEFVDKTDPTRKTVTFASTSTLSAQQIGFAIGPFEKVDLAEFRDPQEIEALGKNAVEMTSYCLPGRIDEVRNTCLPTPGAMDFFVKRYIACPYQKYAMCFVEDMSTDTAVFAEISFCATRMLYPENIIDPAQDVTRSLVQAIATQWIGINVIPEQPQDTWVTIGASHYMADLFMKDLCGNNEYMYRMKKQSDRIVELDHERPSIFETGAYLHVDPSEYAFMALKCPMVFCILDRRIKKVTGGSKLPAVIAKILTRARTDELKDNVLSTDYFQRQVERTFHQSIGDFIAQWVKGAGCPQFQATQRFNKKKLVIEMMIRQVQGAQVMERELDVGTFMRDAREDLNDVYAAEIQRAFTGPMTIRIHEADGTPYEHIVEIKDMTTTVDIPYNTKYKRLKRTKRQKSKAANKTQDGGDEENDALLYCLGDVLQSEEDVAEWRLTDWTVEDEERMNAESYEWIRLDADFEWICNIRLSMPGYMFASQLQQDRDVAAQLESIQHIHNYPPSPLISTILLRTMMDNRYFHGIRTSAVYCLVKHASNDNDADNIGLFHLKKAFEDLYCSSENGSTMTQPNDFSDQLSYYIKCAIIEAISQVRDGKGHTPQIVKEFLLDKLRFNDNSVNDFSDAFYVSRLIRALTGAISARPKQPSDIDVEMDVDLVPDFREMYRLEEACVEEIDRYRRMDEWTSSFQNLYSRTALECQANLLKVGIGQFSSLHFLQYTRPGNYDLLRVVAYDILIQSNVFENNSVLRYILHCMVADNSPFIRAKLRGFIGQALARRAIGEQTADKQATGENLVIEETDGDDQKKERLRRLTIEAAMEALKRDLGQHEYLKRLLWTSANNPEVGYEDVSAILEFCMLLYDAEDTAVVRLVLPRYWKMQNLGKGKLKFTQNGDIRRKPIPKWPPRAATVTHTGPPLSARPLKLNMKNSVAKQGSSKTPTPTPPPPPSRQASVSQAAGPSRIVLKFNRQG